jgi:hypothetical protein
MKLKSLFMAGLVLGFVSLSQLAQAAPTVTMNGDIMEGGVAATGAAISSGANAASPGVSAEMDMEFEIPDVIALGIYQGGDITTTEGAPLLAGRYAAGLNSDLVLNNVTDILNDIILDGNTVDNGTNTDVLKIGGVVYSSTTSAVITAAPGTVGGTANLPTNSISVAFVNGSVGAIDIAFNGSFTGAATSSFTGNSTSITTGPVTMDNADNRGTFLLYGDVIESSVTSADDVGVYLGSVTITAVTN